MKLIRPSYTIIEQQSGLEGTLKHIERVGRVCYKSEDRITEDSYKKFVQMLIDRGHGAMLEHGTVYLEFTNNKYNKYLNNQYSKVVSHRDNSYRKYPIDCEVYYVTTNYRVLLENNWLDDLQYLCKPTEYHEKRITVKFICDRGVSHEFVRHRVFSFAQESTRYCNYSKDKFGRELTFIIPCWLNKSLREEGSYYITEIRKNYYDSYDMKKKYYDIPVYKVNKKTFKFEEFPTIRHPLHRYLDELIRLESLYDSFLEESSGWTPQQARSILPNSLKTELVMTGTIEQWKGFFKLRTHESAHPQARELAVPLEEKFKKLNYI